MRRINSSQRMQFYVDAIPVVKAKPIVKNWQPSDNVRIIMVLFLFTGIAFGFLYFACKLIEAG